DAFRLRLEQAGREDRDEAVRKLREKYSAKTRAAAQKVARAQEAVAQQQAQARSAQMQTAISMGSTLLGAFLGKSRSKLGHMSRASTAARGATRAMKESSDVSAAQEKLTAAEADAAELERELEEQIASLPSPADAALRSAETVRLKLLPATLRIESSGILWTA
ncbi:MAG: ATP-binding protein, partial [Chthoniobacterales bacterium]